MDQQLHAALCMLSSGLRQHGARYLAIGLLCAFLNNVILIGADWAGLHYLVGVTLTVVLVLPLSYLAHALWTFRAPAGYGNFARYVGGSLASLGVAAAAVSLFRGGLDLPMVAAAPLATITMTAFNYGVARWAVTHRPPRITA